MLPKTRIARPPLSLLGIEPVRALLEYARMRLVEQVDVVAGDGHPVVLFPGLGTDQWALDPLKKYCERRGYRCYDWGRGLNTGPRGDVDRWLAELAAEIKTAVSAHEQRATLIGWSLGGIFAREVAKAIPNRVRQVITIGSPMASVTGSTNVGWLYDLLNLGGTPVDRQLALRVRSAPPVPTTSIFSRSDGVVAWQACVDTVGPTSENIEVESSHLGLIWHPDVLAVVAERLAQPVENWRPWVAPVPAPPVLVAAP